MTLHEMIMLTGLSEKELNGYYQNGLIGAAADGVAYFSAQDAKDIGLIRTLKSLGMTDAELHNFFDYMRQSKISQATGLLRALRKKLLKNIREGQTSLDTLDCIIRVIEHKV